jgi:hypothetical protein
MVFEGAGWVPETEVPMAMVFCRWDREGGRDRRTQWLMGGSFRLVIFEERAYIVSRL